MVDRQIILKLQQARKEEIDKERHDRLMKPTPQMVSKKTGAQQNQKVAKEEAKLRYQDSIEKAGDSNGISKNSKKLQRSFQKPDFLSQILNGQGVPVEILLNQHQAKTKIKQGSDFSLCRKLQESDMKSSESQKIMETPSHHSITSISEISPQMNQNAQLQETLESFKSIVLGGFSAIRDDLVAGIERGLERGLELGLERGFLSIKEQMQLQSINDQRQRQKERIDDQILRQQEREEDRMMREREYKELKDFFTLKQQTNELSSIENHELFRSDSTRVKRLTGSKESKLKSQTKLISS